MPDKSVIETKQFSCPKCERDVTFRYVKIQFFASESNQPLASSLDKMIDYGQCQVANNAKVPKHPIVGEMDECPAYQALLKMR
jgi:hypothetical protein